jgi:NifB/MoaA-like Fe-S oxidoreductase
MGIGDLKIIEDLSIELESGKGVLETEDTMTLLDNYIDEIDLKVSKTNVKSVMRSLYMEASEL